MAAETLPLLSAVVHEQSDVLWDVIALLEGARNVPFENHGERGERLIWQAIDRIKSVQSAFDPHI